MAFCVGRNAPERKGEKMQLNELEKINNANAMDGGLQVARVSAVFKEA